MEPETSEPQAPETAAEHMERRVVAVLHGTPLYERTDQTEADRKLEAVASAVGIYLSELHELDELGWGVRARVRPDGLLGAEITLVFTDPRFDTSSQHRCLQVAPNTVWRVAVDNTIRKMAARGTPLTYEVVIGAEHPLLGIFYAAWRESYEGELPALFPYQAKSAAS